MLRNILAAVAAYIVLAIGLMILMAGAWAVLGVNGAFQPGSYEVSTSWIFASIVLSLVAAVAGGFICKAMGRTDSSVNILIGIILVVGVISAWFQMGVEPPDSTRPDVVPMLEAMTKGIQPAWLSWLNPILGAVGVWFGGRLKKAAPAVVEASEE
jgi:hypothetical protein